MKDLNFLLDRKEVRHLRTFPKEVHVLSGDDSRRFVALRHQPSGTNSVDQFEPENATFSLTDLPQESGSRKRATEYAIVPGD
jgi:hypothetical protein